MYVCVLGKEKPGHIPWGDRLRLISNALYERELSPLSDLPISLLPMPSSLSPLYIHLFLFSHIYSPLQRTLLYFIHLALHISSQNLSRFHFELVSPFSVHVHGIHDENEILASWLNTDALTHDLSFTPNEITPESLGLEDELIRWVNNLCAFINDDMKGDWWITEWRYLSYLLTEENFTMITVTVFSSQYLLSASDMILHLLGLKCLLHCKITLQFPQLTQLLNTGMSLFHLSTFLTPSPQIPFLTSS